MPAGHALAASRADLIGRGRVCVAAVLSATLMAAAPHAGIAAQASRPSVVLAADRGGELAPLAVFDGSRWTLPGAVPGSAPRMWTRQYAPGGSATIRTGAEVPGRCTPRRLAVDNAPAKPRGLLDDTFVGIAVSGAATTAPLRRVAENSSEWKRLAAAIAPVFEQRAKGHGVAAASLARVPMTVDYAFATGQAAEAVYYLEVSKRIPDLGDVPPEDPRGVVRISVTGWLRAAGAGVLPAGTKSELSWEAIDTPARPGLLPLGVLRQGDDRVWVMKDGARASFTLYSLEGAVVRQLLTAIPC